MQVWGLLIDTNDLVKQMMFTVYKLLNNSIVTCVNSCFTVQFSMKAGISYHSPALAHSRFNASECMHLHEVT